MPFTVVTLKKVPPSLRGDLTKWLQEIATGVYIGNINSRVRENLWKRIKDNVASGEATISYVARNELGYQFDMINTLRCSVDMDGMPLVMVPKEENEKANSGKRGFSLSSKLHVANRNKSVTGRSNEKTEITTGYVVIDLETNGLDPTSCDILEIGAIKQGNERTEEFNCLIRCSKTIPSHINKLTGISQEMLSQEGISIEKALEQFLSFIENNTIIGYNVSFDVEFLNSSMNRINKPRLKNGTLDLMKIVKSKNMGLESYKLSAVLKEYGIVDEVPHRALGDARLIFELSKKLNII